MSYIFLKSLNLEQQLFLTTHNIKMNDNILKLSAASKLASCNFGIIIYLTCTINLIAWVSLARHLTSELVHTLNILVKQLI